MYEASFTSTTLTYDGLQVGNEYHSISITLISGQNLARGAVLGKITASGKYTLSASAAGNGSETPAAILADSCDASGGDKTCVAYVTGDFDQNKVTLGAGHTLASIWDGLRGKQINLIDVKTVY